MTEGRGKAPPPPDDTSEAFHGNPIDAWTAIGKSAVTLGALVVVVFATLLVERLMTPYFGPTPFGAGTAAGFNLHSVWGAIWK